MGTVRNGVTLETGSFLSDPFTDYVIPSQTLSNGVVISRIRITVDKTGPISVDSQLDLLTKFLSTRLKSSNYITKTAQFFSDAVNRGLIGDINFTNSWDYAGLALLPDYVIESSPTNQYGRMANALSNNFMHFGADWGLNISTNAIASYLHSGNKILDKWTTDLNNGNVGSLIGITSQNIATARSNLGLDRISEIIYHEIGGHFYNPLLSPPNHNVNTALVLDFIDDPIYQIGEMDLWNMGGYFVSNSGQFKGILGNSTGATVNGYREAWAQGHVDSAYTSRVVKGLRDGSISSQEAVDTVKDVIVQQGDQIFYQMAGLFGSTLGRLIGGSDLIIGTVTGSVISAVALSVGQSLGIRYFPNSSNVGYSAVGTGSVWKDFGNNLAQFGVNAGVGSATSYLAAEFAQSLGLNGIAGQLFTTVSGSALQYVATQALASSPVGTVLHIHTPANLGEALKGSIAAFIGAELGSLVITPHTVAEATLASLGSAVGAYFGAGLATSEGVLLGVKLGSWGGPVGVAIGAFVGFVVGALFGSLFGHKKPRIPTASAETVLQIPYARYALGNEVSANGGDLQLADAMASIARDTLNGIIYQITGGLKPSFVSNTYSPTQIYGHSGNQIYVKLGGVKNDVASADQAVNKGVLWALPQTKIIGGNIILKRMLQNGVWTTVTEMIGDMQIASDYEIYLQAKPIIDAAIGDAWSKLSAADQAFYTANKAFMTRAISASQLPLTGSDLNFYNANKTQVDRIIASTQVSSFAAGWIVTLARAAELKLDQFGPSDFYGGLQGFLQSFNVNSTETAVHFEDVSLHQNMNNLAVSITGNAAPGTFSLLPTAINGPADQDIFNPRFQQGATGSWNGVWGGANTNGAQSIPGWTVYNNYANPSAFDWGDNLNSDWSGSGNDVLWIHGSGTPPAGGIIDAHSDPMASTAGVTYTASVYAAQHRGAAQMYMIFMAADGTWLSVVNASGSAREGGSWHGDLSNFNQLVATGTAPAGTAYRKILLRNYATGGADPYAFFTRPESHVSSLGVYNGDWDAGGQALQIANFAVAVGYNITSPGGITNGNDLIIAPNNGQAITVSAGSPGYNYYPYYYSPPTNGGDDIIIGGTAGDNLSAGVGNVWIDGGAGNDTIYGGAGRDVLLGGAGDDYMQAGTGSTYLAGGNGNDTVLGNNGDDVLVGGSGSDNIIGGNGNDTFIIDQDGGNVYDNIDGRDGSDTVSFERFQSQSATLGVNGTLLGGQSIYSPDGRFRLIYQTDGNLVLYGPNGFVWSSGTNGQSVGRVTMQTDGHLCIYNASNQYVWGNGTYGHPGAVLQLDNSGQMRVIDTNSSLLWSNDGTGRIVDGVTIDMSNQSMFGGVSTLGVNAQLNGGQGIWSPDGRYALIYQTDGNLVLYGPNGFIWASNTAGQTVGRTVMQSDGNLVVYNASNVAKWSSVTAGNAGATFQLDNTGLARVVRTNGTAAWQVGGGGALQPRNNTQIYGDQWTSIENLTGSNYNDTLTGSPFGGTIRGLDGNDVLHGGAGNDILEGGKGADYLNGGTGYDIVSYASSSAGVYINLMTGTAIGGDATGDTFNNIGGVIGTAYGDELGGNQYYNSIEAGAGDDWIDASAGADSYNGGEGYDTVDYSLTNFVSGSSTVTYYYNGVPYTYTATIPAVAVTLSSGNATVRNPDGSTAVQTLNSIEQFIGTNGNDSFSSSGTSLNITWDGGGGTDSATGGTGSDTYVYGRNYGSLTISDTNAGSNTFQYKSGVTFDDIWANYASGSLQIGIRGQAAYATITSNFVSNNNVIKTIDMAGASQIDVTQIQGVNILSDGNDTFTGTAGFSRFILANNGNDTVNPFNNAYSTSSSIIGGGLGNDTMVTSAGDDQFLFERGDGHDVITDGGGQNVILFGPTVGANDVIYQIVGNDLYVGIKDLNNAGLTASQVADNIKLVGAGVKYVGMVYGTTYWATNFSIQAGGTTTDLTKANIAWTEQQYYDGGYYYPIVLDLNDDGLQITPVAQSDIVTKDAAGNVLRTSWVGPTNGILAFDRNGDGQINNTADISFVQDKAGATTDLEGLAGWDTNGDAILDANDANFGGLLVWVDANQDGRATAGETKTLAQAGISSIDLTPVPTGFDGKDTIDTVVRNTTTFTRADGTTGTGYDVGFARQLLTGPVATSDAGSIDPKAVGTLGQLLNDPLTLAKNKGLSGSKLTSKAVSNLATVDISTKGGQMSAAAAARWADYIDPAKNAARKQLLAAGGDNGAYLDAIRSSTPYPKGTSLLTARGIRDPQTRLQAIIIDFNRSGPDLIDPNQSHAVIDTMNNGEVAQIGWVQPSDGMLALDRNGDGVVDPANEMSFLADVPNARTSLQGLAAFDDNGDGVLSAADSSFARFLIWRDANGNGLSDIGEVQSLGQAGVEDIRLDTSLLRPDRGVGATNDVLGVSRIDFSDGSNRALYDVALGYADSQDTTTTSQPPTPSGSGAFLTQSLTSSDPGSGISTTADMTQSGSAVGSTATTSVGRAAGTLSGPGGVIVAAGTPTLDDSQWWRDVGVVGQTLADLASPLAGDSNSLGANGSSLAGADVTDAATLQRLMLLRQNVAGLTSDAGGQLAIWERGGDVDSLAALAASGQVPLSSTISQAA